MTLPRISDNTIPSVASWTNSPLVVSGVSNLTSAGSQTTFNFVGKFQDVNVNQEFRVTYITPDNPNANQIFPFKRIKSLFYSNESSTMPPCNVIRPNQVQPVIFPRCQLASVPISFPNIQWLTAFESPELCFGSVTDYEYFLPANWKLGSTTSDGIAWISGGNNETVTSDLFTGDGALIRIRASNKTCGTGLRANGPISFVRISRPVPSRIVDGIALLCSGTSTYTLDLIPPGATVCWSLSNTSVASLPSNPFCGNSVTVTRIGTGNANTVLTANVSDCSGIYPPINFTIAVGTPGNVSLQVNETAFDFCNTGLMQFDAFIENPTPTTRLMWSTLGTGASIRFSGGGYTPVFNIRRTGSFDIIGTISNACGTTNYQEGPFYGEDFYTNYCFTSLNNFSVVPNPVKGNMNIVFENQSKTSDILEIRLYALNSSTIVRQWKINGGQSKITLNTSDLKSGLYNVEILRGGTKVSRQIRIE